MKYTYTYPYKDLIVEKQVKWWGGSDAPVPWQTIVKDGSTVSPTQGVGDLQYAIGLGKNKDGQPLGLFLSRIRFTIPDNYIKGSDFTLKIKLNTSLYHEGYKTSRGYIIKHDPTIYLGLSKDGHGGNIHSKTTDHTQLRPFLNEVPPPPGETEGIPPTGPSENFQYAYRYDYNYSTVSSANKHSFIFNQNCIQSPKEPQLEPGQEYCFYVLPYNSEKFTFDNVFFETDENEPVVEEITFEYDRREYTVSYNANGGTGAPDSQTKIHNEPLILSSEKPTKSSTITKPIYYVYFLDKNKDHPYSSIEQTCIKTTTYSFNSWNTSPSGSGTTYNPGYKYETNSPLTLFAIYDSKFTTADNEITLARAPSKDGYTFEGWEDSSGKLIGQPGDKYHIYDNTNIYARWRTNCLYLTYYSNGADTATFYGETVDLKATGDIITKDQYMPFYNRDGSAYVSDECVYDMDWPETIYLTKAGYKPAQKWSTPDGKYTISQSGRITTPELVVALGGRLDTGDVYIDIYAQWIPLGLINIHDGTTFDNKYMIYIYENDTNKFQHYMPYIHNGTEWVLYTGE